MGSNTDESAAGSPPPRPGGRLLGYLRGDKYMIGAYPPQWQERAAAVPPAATADAAAREG